MILSAPSGKGELETTEETRAQRRDLTRGSKASIRAQGSGKNLRAALHKFREKDRAKREPAVTEEQNPSGRNTPRVPQDPSNKNASRSPEAKTAPRAGIALMQEISEEAQRTNMPRGAGSAGLLRARGKWAPGPARTTLLRAINLRPPEASFRLSKYKLTPHKKAFDPYSLTCDRVGCNKKGHNQTFCPGAPTVPKEGNKIEFVEKLLAAPREDPSEPIGYGGDGRDPGERRWSQRRKSLEGIHTET